MLHSPSDPSVFIAEDDEDDRYFLKAAFSEVGHSAGTRFAVNGEELLRQLEATPPDVPRLILLDRNMPVLGGLEVIRRVRSDPRLAHLPVVILSNAWADPDVSEAYGLGANTVLTKPDSYSELVELVRTWTRSWLEQRR